MFIQVYRTGEEEVLLADQVLRGEVSVAEERAVENLLRLEEQAAHREEVLHDHSGGSFIGGRSPLRQYIHHEKYIPRQGSGLRFLS